MSSKKAVIPEKEKTSVCEDLNKAVSLGDNSWMTLDALKNNCEK